MTTALQQKIQTVAAALTLAAACGPTFALSAPDPIETTRVAASVISEANRYRRSMGVAPVSASEPLMRAAQRYADFLARNMKTGHGADGKSARDRVAVVGYRVCAWGESLFEPNLSFGLPQLRHVGEQAVTYWQPYPGSNRTLLNARVQHVGVGVASWSLDVGQHMHAFKVVYLVAGPCR